MKASANNSESGEDESEDENQPLLRFLNDEDESDSEEDEMEGNSNNFEIMMNKIGDSSCGPMPSEGR